MVATLHNAWPPGAPAAAYQLPAAYGTFLAAFVTRRFASLSRTFPDGNSMESRLLSRHLSRVVYLSLYLLIGGNQIMAIVGGRALDIAALQFQNYFVACILVLVWIRVLAFWQRFG